MLSHIGQEILAYLKSIYAPGSQIKICVDPYTFKKCVEQAGYNYEVVISKLKSSARCQSNEGFKALTIVAFQTKLTYEIAADGRFQDAYLPALNHVGVINSNDYFSGGVKCIGHTAQDLTWDYASNLLKENGLYLDRGNVYEHEGPNRYVQYPRSQQIVSKNDLLKVIDDFESIGLLPGQDIAYVDFLRLMRRSKILIEEVYRVHMECHTSEARNILGHLVYGFYKNWDGSSRPEIERPGGGGGSGLAQENYFFSAYPFDENDLSEITASMYKGSRELKKIPEAVVAGYNFEKSPYFTLVYGYTSEWAFARGLPRLGQSVLVIFEKAYWNKHRAQQFINIDDVFVREWNDYYVVAVKSLTCQIADLLGVGRQLAPSVEYIGGLRSRHAYVQGWLDFAKPKIKLSPEFTSSSVIIANKKHTYSKEISMRDSVVDLDQIELAPDQYFLISNGRRVPDSEFEIASFPLEMKKESLPGWNVSLKDGMNPSSDLRKINVVGFDFLSGDESDERSFLKQLHKFEKRNVPAKNYLLKSKKYT